MSKLWSKTPPNSEGYWWWRSHAEATPRVRRVVIHAGELCIGEFWNREEEERDELHFTLVTGMPGEWGPRIPLPIAPLIEWFQAMQPDGDDFYEFETLEDARSFVGDSGSEIRRGVFVPTEVIQQSAVTR